MKLTPEQEKELAEKKLREKYELDLKKIQAEYESKKDEPPELTPFDKLIRGIMKVPKPDK